MPPNDERIEKGSAPRKGASPLLIDNSSFNALVRSYASSVDAGSVVGWDGFFAAFDTYAENGGSILITREVFEELELFAQSNDATATQREGVERLIDWLSDPTNSDKVEHAMLRMRRAGGTQ